MPLCARHRRRNASPAGSRHWCEHVRVAARSRLGCRLASACPCRDAGIVERDAGERCGLARRDGLAWCCRPQLGALGEVVGVRILGGLRQLVARPAAPRAPARLRWRRAGAPNETPRITIPCEQCREEQRGQQPVPHRRLARRQRTVSVVHALRPRLSDPLRAQRSRRCFSRRSIASISMPPMSILNCFRARGCRSGS